MPLVPYENSCSDSEDENTIEPDAVEIKTRSRIIISVPDVPQDLENNYVKKILIRENAVRSRELFDILQEPAYKPKPVLAKSYKFDAEAVKRKNLIPRNVKTQIRSESNDEEEEIENRDYFSFKNTKISDRENTGMNSSNFLKRRILNEKRSLNTQNGFTLERYRGRNDNLFFINVNSAKSPKKDDTRKTNLYFSSLINKRDTILDKNESFDAKNDFNSSKLKEKIVELPSDDDIDPEFPRNNAHLENIILDESNRHVLRDCSSKENSKERKLRDADCMESPKLIETQNKHEKYFNIKHNASGSFLVKNVDLSSSKLKYDWKLDMLKEETSRLPSSLPSSENEEPSCLSRRKHQITYLAYQAKKNEEQLKNQWAANRMSRKQTQAKYGF